ncbi:hypothetical protein AMTRI_Chr02g216270 [Amborella trichopoda]
MASGSYFEAPQATVKFLCDRLLDKSQPISERFRALFSLRNLQGPAPRDALILAEALGAIGLESNIPTLKRSLLEDPAQEVRETCELALRRIDEQKCVNNIDEISTEMKSPFLSVDPAAPASFSSSIDQLREVLLNERNGMYERYGALFALRNLGVDRAVDAIIASLIAGSALLRHEVAYVLGQLQDKAASAALSDILRNSCEHPMVRHEAAEALGSIADHDSISLLEEFKADSEPIVSQSCEVALSMLEYEQSGKSFEYFFMEAPEVHQIINEA